MFDQFISLIYINFYDQFLNINIDNKSHKIKSHNEEDCFNNT